MKMGNDELLDAVRVAAGNGQRTTGAAGEAFLALVLDGEQAHREWAVQELAAIMRAGSQHRWKHHRKAAGILPAKVGKAVIQVSTTVGITRAAGWMQDEVVRLNRRELGVVSDRRKRARDRQSIVVRAFARLEAVYDRHLDAPTLEDALAAEGTDLAETLGKAS